MQPAGIIIDELPQLHDPVLIAGFDGWGNALNVSKAMAAYMVRKQEAVSFARLEPDTYYRFDENRPVVTIEDGQFKNVAAPGGGFFHVRTGASQRDVVILEAEEPSLNWFTFAGALMDLCGQMRVSTLVTLGSMYDNILHTDRIVSGIANTPKTAALLRENRVNSISYQGPSSIHSVILAEACKRGIENVSLWCHCPYYLQGATHFGQLLHLATLLGKLGIVELDLGDLEIGWKKLKIRIDELVEKNNEVRKVVDELRKRRARGTIDSVRNGLNPDEKVIDLKDFFDPAH